MTALAYERHGAGRVRPAAETGDTRRRIRGFWHRCGAAPGTPAACYLARRGLSWLADHEHVRFRPDCRHPSGATLPAMVCLVLDGSGDICAVHRTFLALDGSKAAAEPVKASWGSFAGGAIRIHPACPAMVVGEGLETTASAAVLLGLPAWSAVACGNLAHRMALPGLVRAVTIAADNDPPGLRAARAAARRWRAEGRNVRIVASTSVGRDFNDALNEPGRAPAGGYQDSANTHHARDTPDVSTGGRP